MSPADDLDRDVVEAALRRRFGGDVVVVDVRRIRPWAVARCALEGAPAPASVIVKWLRSNPADFRVDRRQIAREAAALRAVHSIDPSLVPALVADDLDHDILIVEDLAPRRSLHSVLSSGLSTAGRGGLAGLHTFAATMGRLHASTAAVDMPGAWDELARVLISPDGARNVTDRLDELAPVSSAVRTDLDVALAEVDDPGPLAAFSNGDSGANNLLVQADGSDGRLIDFEHACRRHVLLDAAALHVPGSMWMTLADPVPLGVEATYRTEAGAGIPALLDDDLYGFGLAAASSVRTFSKLDRFEKLDAREAGHHSRPQLITTLERTVATMARWDNLPALTDWLAALAHALRARWPDADVEFPDDYTLREPFEPDH